MTKRIIKITLTAILVISGVFGATEDEPTALAQESTDQTAQESVGHRYGTREPRTCADTKAPTKGPISAALAKKYLECQLEGVRGDVLYLVENVKVEVGGGIPYAAVMRQQTLSEIDVDHPVYPIRGSYLQYQVKDPIRAHTGPTGKHASTNNHPKATGYCYKTTFGDWRCHMVDTASTNKENVRYNVAPPKPEKDSSAEKKATTDTLSDSKRVMPKFDKERKSGGDRDEHGLVKPDFSELEKYFEVVKYEYNPVDGRFTLVVKATKQTNIFKWYLTAYDSDGVKVSETTFNGNVVTPEIGEPTRIYSFAPTESEIRKVARIAFVKKND